MVSHIERGNQKGRYMPVIGETKIDWNQTPPVVSRKSLFTNDEWIEMPVHMSHQQYINWNDGGLPIQIALRDATEDEREFLLTGISPGKWDNLFPKETE